MFSSTSGLFISSYAAYFILGLMRKINFICQIYLHNCRYFELHKQGDNLSISTIYWLRIIGAFPRKGKEMTILSSSPYGGAPNHRRFICRQEELVLPLLDAKLSFLSPFPGRTDWKQTRAVPCHFSNFNMFKSSFIRRQYFF